MFTDTHTVWYDLPVLKLVQKLAVLQVKVKEQHINDP
jgi:hypothetical protein